MIWYVGNYLILCGLVTVLVVWFIKGGKGPK